MYFEVILKLAGAPASLLRDYEAKGYPYHRKRRIRLINFNETEGYPVPTKGDYDRKVIPHDKALAVCRACKAIIVSAITINPADLSSLMLSKYRAVEYDTIIRR